MLDTILLPTSADVPSYSCPTDLHVANDRLVQLSQIVSRRWASTWLGADLHVLYM